MESSIDELIGSMRKKLEVDNPAYLVACVLQMEDVCNTTAIEDGLVTFSSASFVHTGEYFVSVGLI